MNSKIFVAFLVIAITVLGVYSESHNKHHHDQKQQHHSKHYLKHVAKQHAKQHAKHHETKDCEKNPDLECTRDLIEDVIDLIYKLSAKSPPGTEANLAALLVVMTELRHHLEINHDDSNSTLDTKTLKDIVNNLKIIKRILNSKTSSDPISFSTDDFKQIVDAAKELIQDMAYLRVGGMPCELLHYYVMVAVSFVPLNERAESLAHNSNISDSYYAVSNVLDAAADLEDAMQHTPPFPLAIENNCQNSSEDYQNLLTYMSQVMSIVTNISESVIFGVKNNIDISSEFNNIQDKLNPIADAIDSVRQNLKSTSGIHDGVTSLSSALAQINVDPLVSKVESGLDDKAKSEFNLALSELKHITSGPDSLQTFTLEG